MELDYSMLETFVVVCETRNITKAAEILYKTQPTITSRIVHLEKTLGFELLIRQKGKRMITLTSKGENFLAIARELIKLYDQIDEVKDSAAKSFTISSVDSIGTTIVSQISKKMIAQDAIKVKLVTNQTAESYQKVEDRVVDLAFVSERFDYPNVECRPIFKQDFFVVKPDPNPSGVKDIKIEDLDVNNEVFQSFGLDFQNWHDKHWPSYLPAKVRVDSTALVIPFLENEDQWTIIQAGNIKQIQQNLSVQIYKLDNPPSPRICYVLTNKFLNKQTKDIVDDFLSDLKAYIDEEDSLLQSIE